MPVLTHAAVRKYAPQPRRREIRDSQAPGLYLVIQPKPSGHKSWAMRFRRPDGKPAKLTLGRVDLTDSETTDEPVLGGALTLRAARQLANKIDRDRARGQDVVEQHKAQQHRQRTAAIERNANSFGACVREFFAEYKTKRGSRVRRWHGDARMLGLAFPLGCDPAKTEPAILSGSLADIWGDKPVAEIDGHDIHSVVEDARKRGIPGLPRRNRGTSDARGRKLHAALSVLFRWLLQRRKVTSNPAVGVWHPGPPPARERTLTAPELRWFWKACDQIGWPFGPAFQLLLLTGARLNEVTGMCRNELGSDGTWTIPGIRSKNHRAHQVPLPSLARDIINAVPRVESSAGYVFSTTGRRPITGFSKVKAQLDRAMRAEAGSVTVAPWRLHDLRRTAATGMAELGIAPHIVEAVLNHVSGHKAGVAGIYNRATYAPEKQAALRRWAIHVQGVVTGKVAKVVALRGAV
jgi:integrase